MGILCFLWLNEFTGQRYAEAAFVAVVFLVVSGGFQDLFVADRFNTPLLSVLLYSIMLFRSGRIRGAIFENFTGRQKIVTIWWRISW